MGSLMSKVSHVSASDSKRPFEQELPRRAEMRWRVELPRLMRWRDRHHRGTSATLSPTSPSRLAAEMIDAVLSEARAFRSQYSRVEITTRLQIFPSRWHLWKSRRKQERGQGAEIMPCITE